MIYARLRDKSPLICRLRSKQWRHEYKAPSRSSALDDPSSVREGRLATHFATVARRAGPEQAAALIHRKACGIVDWGFGGGFYETGSRRRSSSKDA
jgi:hypothetical protein